MCETGRLSGRKRSRMTTLIWVMPLALCLFLAVGGCVRLGWLVGRRRVLRQGKDANDGLGTVDAAIFGLMGLLVAFTFTSAAGRFDHRRDLITSEVNAIGTAWLRLDLLPPATRAGAQDLFRRYVDERLAIYQATPQSQAMHDALQRAGALQSEIWRRLIAAVPESPNVPLAQTVLPPVNDMFDIATTRLLATEQHPPLAIFLALGAVILISAFHAGFGQSDTARQSMLHLVGFAATTTVAFYLILDLEYPRLGLIRVTDFDQALIDLRASMN